VSHQRRRGCTLAAEDRFVYEVAKGLPSEVT
jgi:hypothetical protein